MFKYIKLHKLSKNQLQQLYNIVSNPEVMKMVGSGIWSIDDLKTKIQYSKEDALTKYKSKYLYYAVEKNKKIIGIIGFHPMVLHKQGLQILIIIDIPYQHLGYAKIFRSFLLDKANKYYKNEKIYILVRSDHPNKIIKKHKPLDTLILKNNKYDVYLLSNPTFLIITPYSVNKQNNLNYMSSDILHNLLIKKGYNEITYNDVCNNISQYNNSQIDFYWITKGADYGHINKQIYFIPAFIKSKLIYIYYEKNILYEKFINLGNSKYVTKQWDFNKLTKLPYDGVFIVKPVLGYQGKCIKIITNNDEFTQYKKYIKSIIDNTHLISLDDKINYKFLSGPLVLNEYLINPLLYKGKKFHLRVYLMFYLYPYLNESGYSVFKLSKILTAKLKYKNDDYQNKDIHDTHIGSTDKDIYFPIDFNISENKINKIKHEINKICGILYNIYKNTLKVDIKTQNSFEIFGVDIMILDDLSVKLIEMNNRIGYHIINPKSTSANKFITKFYKWIIKNSLDKFNLQSFTHRE